MKRPRHGLARVLSKRGICSRAEAERWIRAGRVRLDGRIVRDPWHPADVDTSLIEVEGAAMPAVRPRYLLLNKPRGLVTTVHDERGRDTVYRCLEGACIDGEPIGWIAPVGRLDQASEGLLLFTNDPEWAAHVTDPATGPDKTYHVQVDCLPCVAQLQAMRDGVACGGDILRVKSVAVQRAGEKHAWLAIVLGEGRNRQIRRLLAALDIGVLRLVRVAIGPVQLGELPKGQWRALTDEEAKSLA